MQRNRTRGSASERETRGSGLCRSSLLPSIQAGGDTGRAFFDTMGRMSNRRRPLPALRVWRVNATNGLPKLHPRRRQTAQGQSSGKRGAAGARSERRARRTHPRRIESQHPSRTLPSASAASRMKPSREGSSTSDVTIIDLTNSGGDSTNIRKTFVVLRNCIVSAILASKPAHASGARQEGFSGRHYGHHARSLWRLANGDVPPQADAAHYGCRSTEKPRFT